MRVEVGFAQRRWLCRGARGFFSWACAGPVAAKSEIGSGGLPESRDTSSPSSVGIMDGYDSTLDWPRSGAVQRPWTSVFRPSKYLANHHRAPNPGIKADSKLQSSSGAIELRRLMDSQVASLKPVWTSLCHSPILCHTWPNNWQDFRRLQDRSA